MMKNSAPHNASSSAIFKWLALALSTLSLTAYAADSLPATSRQLWAGHQVVFGTREIPVIGDLVTRSDSFVLASVERSADSMIVTQRACSFSFSKVLGVQVTMASQTITHLPASTFRFDRQADGTYEARPWTVGWGTEDADSDGKPGMTVQVSSSLCSGELQISNQSTSTASGRFSAGDFVGTIKVHTREKPLSASSYCLKVGSKDREETQQGVFVYRPVPTGTTCRQLLRQTWPVMVQPKTEPKQK